MKDKMSRGYAMISLLAAAIIIAVLVMVFFKNESGTSENGNPKGLQPTEVKKGLRAIEKAKIVSDQPRLRSLEIAITRFKLEKNRLPVDLNELIKEGYAQAEELVDHNGNNFHYQNGKVSAHAE